MVAVNLVSQYVKVVSLGIRYPYVLTVNKDEWSDTVLRKEPKNKTPTEHVEAAPERIWCHEDWKT
jgi:hypothetical protein